MKLSKKCQYALKAIFELASQNAARPVNSKIIADAQGISHRFMELILYELKAGGFVESRRGNLGGYILARNPRELTVREIIEYIQGPISVSFNHSGATKIQYFGDLAFKELWEDVNKVIYDVFNNKTFAELVELEEAKRGAKFSNYCI